MHVRTLLDKLNQNVSIKSRLGYGGTEAQIECTEGNLPEITPFQVFKLVWQKMKCKDSDASFFESWFLYFKNSSIG